MNLAIIEQAIKDTLANQVKSGKWKWLKEIKTYGGEFDEDISAVVRSFPAIWVTFDGSRVPEIISPSKTKLRLVFVVLVGARSVRSEEAQRHGDGREIGTYAMLDAVQRLLAGNSLGLSGIAPLELGRIKTIFNGGTRGQSVSVLAQEVMTSYVVTASDRTREEEDPDTAVIKEINIDYVFQPSDDIADEADLVQLKD